MTGVAVKSGLLTGGSRPPRQKPSHSVILTGIPTRTTTHWAAAGPQRAATIPVIDSFDPYVNWPLGYRFRVCWCQAGAHTAGQWRMLHRWLSSFLCSSTTHATPATARLEWQAPTPCCPLFEGVTFTHVARRHFHTAHPKYDSTYADTVGSCTSQHGHSMVTAWRWQWCCEGRVFCGLDVVFCGSDVVCVGSFVVTNVVCIGCCVVTNVVLLRMLCCYECSQGEAMG